MIETGAAPAEDPSTRTSHDLELAQTFASIARSLLARSGIEETLHEICLLAVEVIEGCDHAGVSLVEGRRVTTRGASDPLPEAVDAQQYATDEGPCLDAIRDHEVVELHDLATEARWPDFCAAARKEGVGAMLAFKLFADEETLGALNLYADTPGAFSSSETAREVGAVFAAHAAVALAAARERRHLEEALATRSSISVAMGLIMAREGVSEDEAFRILRRASQRTNLKLRELASRMTEHHDRVVGSSRSAPPTTLLDEAPAPPPA
jgi:GAF domain-containing protein